MFQAGGDDKKKGKDKGALSGFPTEMDPPPEFIAHREEMWKKLKAEYANFVMTQQPIAIKVTLPDGTVKEGESWRTTPYDIARSVR